MHIQHPYVPGIPQAKVNDNNNNNNNNDSTSQRMQAMATAFDLVFNNNERARELYRSQYNKKTQQRQFSVGEEVLVRKVPSTKVANNKLLPEFGGPFRVTKIVDQNIIEVKTHPSRQATRHHINNIKKLNVIEDRQVSLDQVWSDHSIPHPAQSRQARTPDLETPETTVSADSSEHNDLWLQWGETEDRGMDNGEQPVARSTRSRGPASEVPWVMERALEWAPRGQTQQ